MEKAKALIEKYKAGTCTNEEIRIIDQWLFEIHAGEAADLTDEDFEEIETGVWAYVKEKTRKKQSLKLWTRIAAAAAILLIAGLSIFFYTQRHLEGSAATRDLLANDIKPGTNKAILTLANGSTITLTDASNGKLAKEAGVEITKTANGQVVYSSLPSGISPRGGERGVVLNTISTPRGGQYQVRLPDGSKVWLNAASKLTYPVTFNGREDRRVELSGEAYFEIAKDKQHPFKVKTTSQEVEVLGTHFNINSYADETITKTTLLEGSVKVTTRSLHPASLAPSGRGGKAGEGGGNTSLPTGISPQSGERGRGTILKPNQQSIYDGKTIKVGEADPEAAIAWKNGEFIFEDEPLPSILRKVSRWYNVEIVYINQNAKNNTYTGSVSRFNNVSSVLKMLEGTSKVRFTIAGNTIKVE